jgi:hypothetical protein
MSTLITPPEPKTPETIGIPRVTPPPFADEAKLAEELAKIPLEPFLPVEAKLVTWSLVLGVGLLGILVWISYTFFGG